MRRIVARLFDLTDVAEVVADDINRSRAAISLQGTWDDATWLYFIHEALEANEMWSTMDLFQNYVAGWNPARADEGYLNNS